MAMFKKPKWLKPEINEFKYWVHILILSVIVQAIVTYYESAGALVSVQAGTTVLYGLAIAAADVVAHTVLQLD